MKCVFFTTTNMVHRCIVLVIVPGLPSLFSAANVVVNVPSPQEEEEAFSSTWGSVNEISSTWTSSFLIVRSSIFQDYVREARTPGKKRWTLLGQRQRAVALRTCGTMAAQSEAHNSDTYAMDKSHSIYAMCDVMIIFFPRAWWARVRCLSSPRRK